MMVFSIYYSYVQGGASSCSLLFKMFFCTVLLCIMYIAGDNDIYYYEYNS